MSNEAIQLTITDQLSGEDRDRLMGWRERVFPEEGIGMDWSTCDHHVLASSNGEAIGHIGFDLFDLRIDDVPNRCIGVGGVVVVPEFQGQHVPNLMFAGLREWRDLNHPGLFMALFCPRRLVGYYRRHNFVECLQEVAYLQKGNLVASTFAFMTDRPLVASKRIAIPSNPW